MAYKRILFRSAAREKILRGATQLADAVRVTLGPKSKSVLMQKKWSASRTCHEPQFILRGISVGQSLRHRCDHPCYGMHLSISW